MDRNLFLSLLEKYQEGTASPAEKALVEAYYERLRQAGVTDLQPEEEAALKETIYQHISLNMQESKSKPGAVRKLYRPLAAAAAILLIMAAAGYRWLSNRQAHADTKPALAQVTLKDLPPGRDAAVLTLANGQKILLDSASGTISQQGGVRVINMKGLLSYASANAQQQTETVYNTVTTARGNQYQLVLADGSKVWLNSASSLRFPTVFTGSRREVELDGEGYFEIEKNPARPFIVYFSTHAGASKGFGRDGAVEVLGTHFNVNSYHDEEAVKTTLLEGKVKVSSMVNSEWSIIKPGEQVIATSHSPLTIDHSPDLEQVMAWKNGWFEFDKTDLKTIMRQISRWYDVDIIYEKKTGNEKFGGRITRNLNLSNILKMLENDSVHFRVEGKTVVVTD